VHISAQSSHVISTTLLNSLRDQGGKTLQYNYIDIHIIELYFVHCHKMTWGYTMKVCFPVVENQGLASQIFDHFGSAHEFVILDVTTSEFQSIGNCDQIHQHGACNPVAGLGGHHVDAIVVGGIGGGALHKLNAAGIRAFKAQGVTISENIALMKLGTLHEYLPGHTCGGHGHDHGCSH